MVNSTCSQLSLDTSFVCLNQLPFDGNHFDQMATEYQLSSHLQSCLDISHVMSPLKSSFQDEKTPKYMCNVIPAL